MDKSSVLQGFNKHFTEFIEDVKIVFPENLDIVAARVTFFIQLEKQILDWLLGYGKVIYQTNILTK